MTCFCDNYHLKSLINQPTYYKNADSPTYINVLLTLYVPAHKMVKHTQTIHRLRAEELSVFEHFVGLALKGLTNSPQSFQSTCVFKTGLSEFHLMTDSYETKFQEIKTQNYNLYVLQKLLEQKN